MAVIRETRRFNIGPIGVARASRGGQVVAQSIKASADQATQVLFEEGAKIAQQYGLDAAASAAREQIITINPKTGKPEAFDPPEGFGGIATEAYQKVVRSRFQQSIEEEIKIKSRELAVEFENSPNSVGLYQDAMSNYIASMANNATGEFSGFIQDVGTSYLNATRSNLAIAQIKRERAAAKAASKAAFDAGLEAIEETYAINGPDADSAEYLDESVGQIVSDNSEAGLINAAESSAMTVEQRVRRAVGLIRYASRTTNDSKVLRVLQGAIGTQDLNAIPRGYEYIVEALSGLSPSTLRSIEKLSDGVFSDRIPMVEAVEEQTRLELEAVERGRTFDIEQGIETVSSAARVTAATTDAPIAVASNAFSNYQSETARARNLEVSGNSDQAEAVISRRDAHLSAVVEGLAVQALSGLTKEQTFEVEQAVFNADPSLAPEGSRASVSAIIDLSESVQGSVSDDFLSIVGSFRDGPARINEIKARVAAEQALLDDVAPEISSISTSSFDEIGGKVDSAISRIESVDNLDPAIADRSKSDVYLRASHAAASAFFRTSPSKAQMDAARAFIETGDSSDVLSNAQKIYLDEARKYKDLSGNRSGLDTYMNKRASQRTNEIARLKAAEEKRELDESISLGIADPSLKTNQEAFSERLEARYSSLLGDQNLGQFLLSSPDKAGPIIDESRRSNILPRELTSIFKNFASGGPMLNSSPVVLSYWSQLRSGTTELGVEYLSPAVSSLDAKDVGMLDMLAEYSRINGDNPETVASAFENIRRYRDDKNFKATVDARFGEDAASVDAFVLSLDGAEELQSTDLSGLKSVAINMAAIGFDQSEIQDRLERQMNVTYPKTEGMVLSRAGRGRSAAALSRVIPAKSLPIFQEMVESRILENGYIGFDPSQESLGEKVTSAYFGARPERYEGMSASEFARTQASMAEEGMIVLQPVGPIKVGSTSYRALLRKDGEFTPIFYNEGGDAVPAIFSTSDPMFIQLVKDKEKADADEMMRRAEEQPSVSELEERRMRR